MCGYNVARSLKHFDYMLRIENHYINEYIELWFSDGCTSVKIKMSYSIRQNNSFRTKMNINK